MGADGQLHIAGHSQQHGSVPRGSDAPRVVLEWNSLNQERIADPAGRFVRPLLTFVGPAVVCRQSSGQLHQHAALRNIGQFRHDFRLRLDNAWLADAMKTRRHNFVVEQGAVNRNRVEHPCETIADANLIVINDRRLNCLAAVTPSSLRRLAIDPPSDRLRIAKSIRNRNVMPPGANGKAKPRIPAMPVCFGARQLRCEQETEFCFILYTDHPQRPVLIIAGELRRAGSAFANDVADLTFTKDRRIDPCFDRDGIAVRKIEVAVRPCIGNKQVGAGINSHGRVIRSHVGKLRRPRPSLITLHVTFGSKRSRFLSTKIPPCDR